MNQASMGDTRSRVLVGWIEAIAFVFAIGVISIVYAVAHTKGAHVVALMLYSMTLAGVALLIVNGTGAGGWAIAAAPISWLVGGANILVEVGYFMLVTYVTPAEASLLVRQALAWSLVIGAVMFARRVGWLAWIGAAIVLAAVAWLAVGVPADRRVAALAFAALCAVSFVVRGYASEFHAWNRAAKTIREKMQVTGIVTLVTALGSWVLVGLLMAAVEQGTLPPNPVIPRPADLAHGPTIVIAVLVGGAIFTAMNYLAFSSVVKIGTDGFIAASTFMPPATLLVQALAERVGIIPLQVFDWSLLPAMALAVAGVMLVIVEQRRRSPT